MNSISTKRSSAVATTSSTCVLRCTGTIDQLAPILADFSPPRLEPNLSHDSPIACDALKRLYAEPSQSNPLVLDYLHNARRIVGLISFVTSVLNEVLFAFKVLSTKADSHSTHGAIFDA